MPTDVQLIRCLGTQSSHRKRATCRTEEMEHQGRDNLLRRSCDRAGHGAQRPGDGAEVRRAIPKLTVVFSARRSPICLRCTRRTPTVTLEGRVREAVAAIPATPLGFTRRGVNHRGMVGNDGERGRARHTVLYRGGEGLSARRCRAPRTDSAHHWRVQRSSIAGDFGQGQT
jgi:hypothetical protein